MLKNIGGKHAMRKHERPTPIHSMNFLEDDSGSSLDITRSTDALYIDSDGKWSKASSNTVRIHHDFKTGVRRGLLIEEERTCKNHYARPVDTSLGDHFNSGGSNVTRTTDGQIGDVINTTDFSQAIAIWEIDNTGGGSPVTVNWEGATGNTNSHSIQCLYRIREDSGDLPVISISGEGETTLDNNDDNWNYAVNHDVTPANNSGYFRIVVPVGCRVRLHFMNMQENNYVTPMYRGRATTFIDAGGEATTRDRDRVTFSGDFNDEQGTIVVKGYVSSVLQFNTYLWSLYDASNAGDELLAVQVFANSGTAGLRIKTGGNLDFDKAFENTRRMPYYYDHAVSYGSFGLRGYGNGILIKDGATELPTGLDTVSFYRSDNSFGTTQIIEKFEYYDKAAPQASTLSRNSHDDQIIVVGAGQSGGAKLETLYDEAGEINLENVLLANANVINGEFVNGAYGGSAADKRADDGAGYWYNNETGAVEDVYNDYFLTNIDLRSHGRNGVKYIYWNQGEKDYFGIDDGLITKADYKNATKKIMQKFANQFPQAKVIFGVLNRYEGTPGTYEDSSIQAVREAQREVAEEEPNVLGIVETYDLVMVDDFHQDQAGYEEIGRRIAALALADKGYASATGTVGPSISGATFTDSSADITVSITHDGGTALSGSETIGFRVLVNGTPATVSSITTGANLTVTLSSALSSGDVITLDYVWGLMNGYTPANAIVDNADNPMPLQGVYGLSVSEV